MNIHVTKKSSDVEIFNNAKYKKCLENTLRAAGYSHDQTAKIIDEIFSATEIWLKNKHEVSSLDIYSFTEKYLNKHYKKVALVYKKYQEIW
jgi:transcriptional regulator NrdR family protein